VGDQLPVLEHACFISYKHPPPRGAARRVAHFYTEFVDAFHARLDAFLTIDPDIYYDATLKAVPGRPYPAELSLHLCRSASLIAILVPEYWESSWCLAEWEAMNGLAEQRVGVASAKGHIIPVLVRGDETKAQELADTREIVDLRYVNKPSTQLGTVSSREKIEHIAQMVAAAVQQVADIQPCDQFAIPVGEEVITPGLDDPNPLT
jgi:TIR domain